MPDIVKSIMQIIFGLTFIVMVPLTFWTWITTNNNFMAYIIATLIIGGVVHLLTSDSDQTYTDSTFITTYLGGFSPIVLDKLTPVILKLDNDTLNLAYNDQNYVIPLISINNASEQTHETLTVGRFLAFGVFAFALKKKNKYLLINLKNDVGQDNSLLFKTSQANYIAQLINQKSYYALKNINATTIKAGL